MRSILISIRPQFAEKILSGEKLYEFRRVWPAGEIFNLVIYSSSPIKALVGTVGVKAVERASKNAVWERTSSGAGISKQHFLDYFAGKKMANALVLHRPKRYSLPKDPTAILQGFRAPQSFRYLDDDELLSIRQSRPTKRGRA